MTHDKLLTQFTNVLKEAENVRDKRKKEEQTIQKYLKTHYDISNGAILVQFTYSAEYSIALVVFMKSIEVPVPENDIPNNVQTYSMYYRVAGVVKVVPLALAGLSASITLNTQTLKFNISTSDDNSYDASAFMQSFCMKPKGIFYICVDVGTGRLVRRLIPSSDTTDDDISTSSTSSTSGTPSSMTSTTGQLDGLSGSELLEKAMKSVTKEAIFRNFPDFEEYLENKKKI